MDKNGKLIIEQLRNRNFAPLYVLEGEEPFYIDAIVDIMLQDIIPEEEKDFNQKVLYGSEVTVKDIINEACGLPMFGERMLVVVKEAQVLKKTEDFIPYFERPNMSTILVLEHKHKVVDKRTKFAKVISMTATNYVSRKVSDADLPAWIMNRCAEKNLKLTHELADMLSVYLGNDLQKIDNELDKIRLNEPTLTEITAAIIERQVGISREYNLFDFSNAVFHNDKPRIARMLNYFTANPKDASINAVVGMFHSFLQKVFLSYQLPNDFPTNKKYGIHADQRNFAQKYPLPVYHQLAIIMEEYSRKSVGIDSSYSATPHLLKEMTARMTNLLH